MLVLKLLLLPVSGCAAVLELWINSAWSLISEYFLSICASRSACSLRIRSSFSARAWSSASAALVKRTGSGSTGSSLVFSLASSCGTGEEAGGGMEKGFGSFGFDWVVAETMFVAEGFALKIAGADLGEGDRAGGDGDEAARVRNVLG